MNESETVSTFKSQSAMAQMINARTVESKKKNVLRMLQSKARVCWWFIFFFCHLLLCFSFFYWIARGFCWSNASHTIAIRLLDFWQYVSCTFASWIDTLEWFFKSSLSDSATTTTKILKRQSQSIWIFWPIKMLSFRLR